MTERRQGTSLRGSLYEAGDGKSTLSSPSARVSTSPTSVAYYYFILFVETFSHTFFGLLLIIAIFG